MQRKLRNLIATKDCNTDRSIKHLVALVSLMKVIFPKFLLIPVSRASLRMRNVPTQGGVGVASITRSCWTMALHALEAIKYNEGRLEILNQLLLPSQSVYEHITSVQEAWEAIRSMKVG